MKISEFSGTGALIYDPNTGNPDGTGRQLFPDNRIPPERFDRAALKMLQLIPAADCAADGSILNLNDYTEITSAQATARQVLFTMRLVF